MTAQTDETYFPEPRAAEVHDFISAHKAKNGAAPEPRFLLVGNEPGEQIELPQSMYDVLVQVVDAMTQGKAVTVSSTEQRMTTQTAADFLGVSRPTVVRLIESGQLPAERVGTRRRVRLPDVLALRASRRQAQLDALAATTTALEDEQYLD